MPKRTHKPTAPVRQRKPAITQPAFVTVPDWCTYSGMGRTTVYELIGAGKLAARKQGRRTLIDMARGLEYMWSLPAAEVRPPTRHNPATPAPAAAP